eukprot:4568027-Amphidinium_carterae.1
MPQATPHYITASLQHEFPKVNDFSLLDVLVSRVSGHTCALDGIHEKAPCGDRTTGGLKW